MIASLINLEIQIVENHHKEWSANVEISLSRNPSTQTPSFILCQVITPKSVKNSERRQESENSENQMFDLPLLYGKVNFPVKWLPNIVKVTCSQVPFDSICLA